MPIAPSMQHFVDDELARSAALAERAVAGTLHALAEARSAPTERAQHANLHEALRRQAGACAGRFVESLTTRVQAALRERHDEALPGAHANLDKLELMDESRVEIEIEISRATQAIDTVVEWELRELQTFTSTLAGQPHVAAETNPFRPVFYASALWDAAGEVASSHALRAMLLRVSAGVLAGLLKQAMAAACTRLEARGVEPGLYRTVVLAPGVGARPLAAPSPHADPQTSPQTSPIALLASLSNATSTNPRLALAAAPGPGVEPALFGLDALVSRLPATGIHRDDLTALRQPMREQHELLKASVANVAHRQGIDLVCRLFDAMRADSQLNPAVRALLARLEGSALRVALQDESLLQSYDHPVWQLVNGIGETGNAYPQPGDPRLAALLPFCRALTDEIARTPLPDAALYRRGATRLAGFVAEQLNWQIKDAQATVAVLMHTEQRELLEHQIAERLASELAASPASPGVRRFIVGPWAQVIAESMLRSGRESDATNAFLQTVDDLLWSVKLPDHPQSRQRLISLLPGLLHRLRAGMTLIALPPAEQQAVLDELMAIHTEALRPGARSQPEASDAAEIVRRMRDEVLSSIPGELPGGDAVIDLASMETVPAELLPDDPPAIDSPARLIDAMQPGSRYRLFVHGRWSRTQLLWRSPKGRLFLFAGENPSRPHSITRRALERLGEAGLAHFQTDVPLVRRAAEALAQGVAPGG